ncbi:nucleolar complex protein 4 homolog [Bombina bombina]|uniref:nucleolar complex protein 4 homolog n=1 Tax=Bombina bombina TaxID=8345 RepID=UPI00235B2361|nr:nucleolar complex protein 4 homolog [Bombina bombina]
MAARKGQHASRSRGTEGMAADSARRDLAAKLEAVLENRGNANAVFDILEYLESPKEDIVQAAIRTCSKMFETLLEKGELFVGDLPKEDESLPETCSAEEKFKMWMRHRYNSCVTCLLDLMQNSYFNVQELALCTLMKFIQLEGKFPLEKAEWKESFCFPLLLLKSVVNSLLQEDADAHLLISRYQEYVEYDDVRYYTMAATSEIIARVHQKNKEGLPVLFQNNVFCLLSSINMPEEEGALSNFLVTPKAKDEDWKPSKLKEQKRVFERIWMGFLKHKLQINMYKKVLLIMHESILPHMSKPTLMIDFLTAAYEIGGAISLLALNGLFMLIHQHNLEYPDFYKKLYCLLDPSVFHVKYRARFFHLANLFLSSTHLPVYLVAAFAKRLARLSLTAPPQALLMIIPFICNLIRRHPACRPLIHRPAATTDLMMDPYCMDEPDPAKCRALESSLWELEALQTHYHPDVVRAANVISRALSTQESDISELLEISSYELFDKELKKKFGSVPLEFEPVQGLLGRKHDIIVDHFAL